MKEPNIEIVVIKDIRRLDNIRDDWVRLQWHPNADIDYFIHYIQSRDSVRMPCVILVYECGVPKTILVGRIEDTVISFNVGYKRIYEKKVRMTCRQLWGLFRK